MNTFQAVLATARAKRVEIAQRHARISQDRQSAYIEYMRPLMERERLREEQRASEQLFNGLDIKQAQI